MLTAQIDSTCNLVSRKIYSHFTLHYLHKFDLRKPDLPKLLDKYQKREFEINPLNYPTIFRSRGLRSFSNVDNAIEAIGNEYLIRLIGIENAFNALLSEIDTSQSIVAYAPSSTLKISVNQAQCIFKKLPNAKSSNGGTTDQELWNNITCDLQEDTGFKQLIVIDDCLSAGRTVNISKHKLEERINRNINVISIAVLFDPPPPKIDYGIFNLE